MTELIFKIRNEGYIESIPVQVKVEEKTIYFSFPYHKNLKDEIHIMEGARWHPDDKLWSVRNTERNQYAIKWLCGEKSERYYNKIKETVWCPDWDLNLFEHQAEALLFIIQRRRCMLAMEMGLGKTLIMLKLMEYAAINENRCIWWLVAPYGAQKEWERQIKFWQAPIYPAIVTTYESLSKWLDRIPEPKRDNLVPDTSSLLPQGLIFDESIKIKTPTAQRSQIANTLCELIRKRDSEAYIILLSGAPAPKDPSDWWHQVECCQPGFIREGSWHKFRNRYANIERRTGEYGEYPHLVSWKTDEVKKLGHRLAPIVMVRDRKDCFDLPDKIYDPIQCEVLENIKRLATVLAATSISVLDCLEKLRELSDGFQYNKMHRSITNNNTQTEYKDSNSNNLESTSYSWIGSPKLDKVKELLDFYSVENGGPGRLVIYAAFTATIDKLMEVVAEAKWNPLRIDGRGWSNSKTLELFEGESNDKSTLNQFCIVANPACVHGLTLSRTYALVYYSNSFSADHRIQSEDRRDRPGMDVSRGTRIIDLLHLPTDLMILNRLKEKREMQGLTLEEIKLCLK